MIFNRLFYKMVFYPRFFLLAEAVDPLSPYLFTLAVEILAIMIRNNKKIKGLRIDGLEIKLGQYADDTQIFLDGSEKALDSTLTVLKEFRSLSGLKIIMEKTKAVLIG